MAQLSAGMSVEYGESTSGNVPSTWKKVPDITSIPAMGGNVSTHDVTTIYNEMKVYIEGLPDVGGTLAFAANFTPELFNVVEEIRTAQAGGKKHAFSVVYPAPLSKRVWFLGTVAQLASDEAAVDAPLTCNVNITPSSDFEWVDESSSSALASTFTSPSSGSGRMR